MTATATAQYVAQLVRDAIPTQISRATDSVMYGRRELSMMVSFLRKVTITTTGEREITLTYPAWRGSRWQGYITALIDRACEDRPDLYDNGHIMDREATTTTFTW